MALNQCLLEIVFKLGKVSQCKLLDESGTNSLRKESPPPTRVTVVPVFRYSSINSQCIMPPPTSPLVSRVWKLRWK